MSWVSLSGSDGADSGRDSYKEVAKQAFASPTNLSSRLGNRTPAKDGIHGISPSGSFSNTGRRAPSKINSQDEAEAFHQMFNSTAVQVSRKHSKAKEKETKPTDLGEGLKALARRASRQYQVELNSTDAEASCSIEKESFSIGSVSRRTKDLDLAHNDNSFHVIGGLIVEFFQSKQKSGNRDLRLTPQDIAQLDRLAPPRVRASFVEAVRYRFTNAPMDSTSSVHTLARQCHDLGLDAEGPQNPLLVAAETEIVISFPQGSQKPSKNFTSSHSSENASSGGSETSGVESVTPSGSTPSSYPSAAENRKVDPGAAGAKGPLCSIPPPGYVGGPYSSNNSAFLPAIGRPSRHGGADPPASASVSTRLTRMGVEVPFAGSESESGENGSSSESVSQSQDSSFHRPDPSEGSFHTRDNSIQAGVNSVRTSLTKFGIEMPRYEESVSSLHGTGGVSVLTDMKSMASNLTKLGVEMPLGSGASGSQHHASGSAASAVSQSAVSQSDSGVSHDTGLQSGMQSNNLTSVVAAAAEKTKIQPTPVVETVVDSMVVSPIMSLASKASKADNDEDSSILHIASSQGFSNNGVSLAKQQLLAELAEASNLMTESKTQEAAKFWRDHVLELEGRLRALNGDDGSALSSHVDKPPAAFSDVKSVSEAAPETHMSMSMSAPPPEPEANNASIAVNAVTVNTLSTTNDAANPPQPGETSAPPPRETVVQPPTPPMEIFNQEEPTTSAPDAPEQDQAINYETASARAPLMIDPSLEGVPMVDVVAPADLPGGYHFEAEIEGRRFLATVPAGGVQKGETFSCYMRDLEKVGSDIPVGRWRDGLFDCCSFGCCHPVIFNALCCPLVILGQIMTRVGFDFLGRPSLDNSVNGPNTLWTILCFWVFVNLALFSAYNFKWSQGMELSMADLGSLAFVNVAYLLFVVYLTSATRGSLREKYYIRESRFHDLEDCCCATFCLPCAVCQMARHTADYDEYEGVCCNDTGLPDSYKANAEPKQQAGNYLV